MEENRGSVEKQKSKSFIRRHPFLVAVLSSVVPGACFSAFVGVGSIGEAFTDGYGFFEWVKEFVAGIFGGAFFFGGLIIFPFVLTGVEIYLLKKGHSDQELYRRCRIFDIVGIGLGVLYSLFYLSLVDEAVFGADWQEQLVNRQMHTPIYSGALPTVIAVGVVAVAGYFVVNYIPLKKLPPLVAVLGMAAMYLGTAESILWGIQVFQDILDFFLLLFPLNCVLLTARTVRYKIWEWQEMREAENAGGGGADCTGQKPVSENGVRQERFSEDSTESGSCQRRSHTAEWEQGRGKEGIFAACGRFLSDAAHWPLLAFLLMWPLLGILIGILLLFGQSPDAVIRAFTETSDWNLSRRVAPQNVYYDEHYLCTVAAGGHEKAVKPKRLGVRHGHPVIVNRQLCVANAFEQVLEERTPRLHRAVRHFYDTYGFPVAKLIRSRYTADVIYFLMKPLEWMFLIVLYLTDVNPENRIAIQYTGKSLKDFGLA